MLIADEVRRTVMLRSAVVPEDQARNKCNLELPRRFSQFADDRRTSIALARVTVRSPDVHSLGQDDQGP